MSPPLLDVQRLVVRYPGRRKRDWLIAVDDVSLAIGAGQALGLIGESGCGKSTVARAVLGLVKPHSGHVLIAGTNAWEQPNAAQREFRRAVQAVFQDPHESLDPRMSALDAVAEPLHLVPELTRADRQVRAFELLDRVGIGPDMAPRRPHELSGGQKQRVTIARALAVDPELVVCDEPVSALDVSVQAGVLNLLNELRGERDLAYLFITHDLGVAEYIADTIAVMYLGVLVETGLASDVVQKPKHPYTQALIAARPRPVTREQRVGELEPLAGDIPSPAAIPSGCRFRTRCPFAVTRCAEEVPQLRPVGSGRLVACHLVPDDAAGPFEPAHPPQSNHHDSAWEVAP